MLTPYQRCEVAAATVPDAIAMDFGGRVVTYEELRRLVVVAATHLAGLGLPTQSRIGLVATRDLSTYVAYLAILRCAHVVVPLGPDNPVRHHETVARLAGLRAVVADPTAHATLTRAVGALGVPVLDAGRLDRPGADGDADAAVAGPEDTAYILFTSGSTGRPKGVPISNGNVSSYLDHVVPRCGLGPGARLSHTFALTFDPSVFDLFGSWSTGATLVIPRNRELLLPASYVRARRITHWYSVPSLVSYARRIGNLTAGSMDCLRWSMFIGEPLHEETAALWSAAASGSIVENVYGPTELTVSCSDYRLTDAPDRRATRNGTVPIGAVYPGLEWMLIDGGRVVDGEGELCVRGPQRFVGYLDPADNAGRFVRTDGRDVTVLGEGDPVRPTDWYRTGDRVHSHGRDLVHLGRIDRQVKVSGYRIELSEVEGTIRRHPAVTDAAVLARPDPRGALSLHAVLCGASDRDTEVRTFLLDHLPAYMVPSRFVWLPEFPLNASGKVDYLALVRMTGVAA
jgi:amino acid adenylation domain-containing protein